MLPVLAEGRKGCQSLVIDVIALLPFHTPYDDGIALSRPLRHLSSGPEDAAVPTGSANISSGRCALIKLSHFASRCHGDTSFGKRTPRHPCGALACASLRRFHCD